MKYKVYNHRVNVFLEGYHTKGMAAQLVDCLNMPVKHKKEKAMPRKEWVVVEVLDSNVDQPMRGISAKRMWADELHSTSTVDLRPLDLFQ